MDFHNILYYISRFRTFPVFVEIKRNYRTLL